MLELLKDLLPIFEQIAKASATPYDDMALAIIRQLIKACENQEKQGK